MGRFLFTVTAFLVAAAAMVSASEPTVHALPVQSAPVSPAQGEAFTEWGSFEVFRAKNRLAFYMQHQRNSMETDSSILTKDERTPQGVYDVVRDADDNFKNNVIPAVIQLKDSLKTSVVDDLSGPLTDAVKQHKARIDRGDDRDQPDGDVDIINLLIRQMKDESLRDFLTSLFGLQVAESIYKLLRPIQDSALSLLAHDLRDVAGKITSAILSGEKYDQWSQELKELVTRDLRFNTLALLATAKESLDKNLTPLIEAAIAASLGLDDIGTRIIDRLFHDTIQDSVTKAVEVQIDALSARLRAQWDIPALKSMISSIMNKSSALNAMKSPATAPTA